MKRIVLSIALSCLSFASLLGQTTHTAASVAESAVKAAYDLCSDGDTLRIPAGSASWTSGLMQTMTKDIIIQGAGKDLTTITANFEPIISCANNVRMRICDVGFVQTASTSTSFILKLRGANNWVVRCKFLATAVKATAVHPSGGSGNPQATGLVADSILYDTRSNVQGDLNNSTSHFGRREWANTDHTAEIGSAETMVFERNVLTLSGAVTPGMNQNDHENGGHSVIRFNTYYDSTIFGHGTKNVEDADTSSQRGTKFIEAYFNTFVFSVISGYRDPAIWQRGGRLIAFNNSVSGIYANAAVVQLGQEDLFKPDHYGQHPLDGNQAITNGTGTHNGGNNASVLTFPSNGYGTDVLVGITVYNLTDGSKGTITDSTSTSITATLAGGTDNDWDTGDNFKISAGYPQRDQIGTGTDEFLWLDGGPYPAQAVAPSLQWSNTLDGSPVSFTIADTLLDSTGNAYLVEENRDYHNHGAGSYSGSVGIKSGTRAAMDAITPAITGVYFWVTDEGSWNTLLPANTSGRLYRWSGSAWVLYYTPLTYPHPLMAEVPPEPSGATPPRYIPPSVRGVGARRR